MRPPYGQDIRTLHGEQGFSFEIAEGGFGRELIDSDVQAAMVMDIRFQQLFAERAQSTSVLTPQAVPMPMPVPTVPTPSPSSSLPVPISMPVPVPMPLPIPPINTKESQPSSFPQPQMVESSTRPSSHTRHPSVGSSTVLFVLVMLLLPLSVV